MGDREEFEQMMKSSGVTPLGEAAAAIKEMVDSLKSQGFSRWEALFFAANYLAAQARFNMEEDPDERT